MANLIKLADIAQREFEDSALWYTRVSETVRQNFIDEVYKAFDAISRNPEFYPKKKGKNREYVLRKFRFVVVYEFLPKEDSVYILHVFHTSRHPKHKYKRN